MKVLYAYRYGIIGGVYTQLALRRRALDDIGIHCELFFSQDNGLAQVLKDRNGIHFGAQISFRTLVRKGRFDAVVVIDSPELLDAAAGPIFNRNSIYLDVHTTTNTGLAYLADIDPSRLAGVMAPTNYSKNLVEARLPADTSIHVMPNILETEIFSPGPKPETTAESQYVSNKPREFVWVGKLDHHKNWRLALVYGAMLRDLYGSIRLHMVGGYAAPVGQAKAFFDFAFQLGISDQVNWMDRVENVELVDVYRRCAESGGAMLITSRDESFGMAAAEALLCGCPLVTNDLPVFREVFPSSPLVQRVDIWQPYQVASAAAALSESQSESEIINMRRQLCDKYDSQAFVDAFKKLFVV